MTVERRSGLVELRAAGRRLEGTAAPFNVPTRIGGFVEMIRPGAFRATLADGHDIVAMAEHDTTKVLGRTRSGSLTLIEDGRGLQFSLEVPDTTLGRDMLAMAQRGDLGGLSIGFRPIDEAWPTRDTRELRAVELVEVSIISAFPAYPGTTVAARARGHESPALRLRRLYLETLR